MSKQSEAKAAQNYRKTPNTCSNCAHYECKVVEKTYNHWSGMSIWEEQRCKTCSLGGFAVLKTATCDSHSMRDAIDAAMEMENENAMP